MHACHMRPNDLGHVTWVVLIMINIALMAFSSYKEAVWQGNLTAISEAFFSAVFVVKCPAAYPSSYFKSPWNQFDCSLLMLHYNRFDAVAYGSGWRFRHRVLANNSRA